MTRYAVPLLDLDAAWRTPAGSALVEAAVEDQEGGEAEVVTAGGTDAVVPAGPEPTVATLIAGLFRTSLPLAEPRPVRVFAEGPSGWRAVVTPPEVPVLPDDEPVFADEEN